MITIKRSLVKKLLSQPDSLDLLRQGLAEMAGQKLGRFAEAVCGLFDCRADHGKLQKRTCAQALKERDRKEFISLASSLGDKLERSAARSWKAFLQRRFEEGEPVPLKGVRAGADLRFSTSAVSASRRFRHWAGAASDEARAMEAWRARPAPAAPERSWSLAWPSPRTDGGRSSTPGRLLEKEASLASPAALATPSAPCAHGRGGLGPLCAGMPCPCRPQTGRSRQAGRRRT